MSETYDAVERKTSGTVMGTTSSKQGSFAISDAANTELNRLTFIAARFLSSSDLYDMENLVKPGTCGNYSVFMRKGIEATLLPFVVDLSGGKTAEVFYQDPRKAIDNLGVRKKICEQLAHTMVRAVATITAALASIQIVKSGPNREAFIKQQGGSQSGGDIRDIGQWLASTGYIPPGQSAYANKPIDFQVPGGRYPTPNVKFTLILEKSEGILSQGLFRAESQTSQYPLPSNYLRVHFLHQVAIPGTSKTCLPIRVADGAGVIWLAGILIDEKFKSFVDETPDIYITRLLEHLYITAAGGSSQIPYPETQNTLKAANDIFRELRRSNNDVSVLARTMNHYFSTKVPGYRQPGAYMQPGYPAAYPPAAYPPAYPAQQAYPSQAYPSQAYPTAYPSQQAYPQQQKPLSYGLDFRYGPQPLGIDGQYDIQGNAAIYIRRMFEIFRKLIASQSCPAEERATALFGAGYDEKQFIRTAVCNDPYWKKQNLSDIFPWLSFQFLSIKDWNKAGGRPFGPGQGQIQGQVSTDNYDSNWTQFIDGLESRYGKERLSRPTGSYNLDQMRFTNTVNQCKPAKPGPVFQGITDLHSLYDRHNSRIWNIINDLVIRIKHPETNQDIIRLHPNIISGNKSSAAYVEEKAAAVRAALKDHYLDIEDAYLRITKTLL